MNLNTASNEELESYRIKTASVLKIDPFMLDFIWMNDPDTGLKNRVLYAKRGAAEVLRQNLGISILSMEHYESNGWLMFTAIGKDAKGRQEIAHGAAYVDGLKADKKAHSVMTASTRALRRLTLQFVAGGVLDESEVQAQSALQGIPPASEAALAGSPTVLPPPTTTPSEALGKDITMPRELPAPVADMGSHIEKVYADGAKALADMQPAKTSATFDVGGPPNVTLSTPSSPEIVSSQADIKADIEPPKRRGRRPGSRNRVNIQSPGQQTEMPAGQIDASGNITPAQPISVPLATANDPEQGTSGNGPLRVPALAEIPKLTSQPIGVVTPPPQPVEAVAPQVVVPVLPKEKQEEYRTRLSKYYNDILPKGGMQSSEGVGGPTMKTRKFAAIYTGVVDTKLMTEQHWNDLFEFLDANAANPKFLVEYINKALGVA